MGENLGFSPSLLLKWNMQVRIQKLFEARGLTPLLGNILQAPMPISIKLFTYLTRDKIYVEYFSNKNQ